jgi:hypothetical protein
MVLTVARMGLLTALALNTVNLNTQITSLGLPMTSDCVYRDAVFEQLKDAMAKVGLTSADHYRSI